MYTVFSYGCLILVTGICIWSIVWKKNGSTVIREELLANRLHYLLLGILACIFLVTRFYQLGSIPEEIHIDEYGMLYDAFCIGNYGVDRYAVSFPVYFINFGGGQNALYTYLTAIIFKILGFTVANMRLAAVLSGFACFSCAYLTGRELVGKKMEALVPPFLVTVLPYFFMAQRWGLESHLLASYLTIAVFFVIKAAKSAKTRYYIFAGIFCGITLYTYAVCWLMLPVFLMLLFVYMIRIKKMTLKNASAFAVSTFLMAWPLMLFMLVNNGIIPEIRTPFFSVVQVVYRGSEISLSHFWNNLSLFKMMVTHGSLEYNALPKYGTVYIFSVPLIIYGLGISIRRAYIAWRDKVWDAAAVICILFFSVYFSLTLVADLNINKVNGIYPVFVMLIFLAVQNLVQKSRYLLPALAVAYLLSFFMFAKFYYLEFNRTKQPNFESYARVKEMLDFIDNIEGEELPVYIYDKAINSKSLIDARDLYLRTYKQISPYEKLNHEVESGRYHYFLPDDMGIDDQAIYVIDNSISHVSSWLAENGWQRYDGIEGVSILFQQ